MKQRIFLAGAALAALVSVGLTACSDDPPASDGSAPVAPSTRVPPASESATVPVPEAKRDYRVIDTFNVGEYTYVRSLVLDKKKSSVWVGTSVGAMEVDVATHALLGTYTREHGLANEYVFGMLIDSQGSRWFGTNGGGVSRLSAENEWQTYFPMHGLADYWIYSFVEDAKGDIWIGTWAGLSHFAPKTGKFTTYLTQLVNEWVYGLGVDSKDNVWIGTEGGVNMFDGSQWHTWTHDDGLGASNENNLPVSINTGLGTRSRHDLSIMAEGQSTYNPNYIFSLLVDPEDNVWAGTWGGGVARFDGAKWENFTIMDGLGGNIVYSIARSEDGVMWFGTSGGLTSYDGKDWQVFTKQDGLLDDHVYAIVPTDNGEVWVGTRSGVALLSKSLNAEQ